MDVIHKVFVSSTYTDLRLERAAVERTLLHLKCFPIGMEIFPAANDSAWDFIKQQIDDSDYYVLIIAARYGSVHPETGKSYTEMEFDYASKRGIPILAFIHEDPGRIHDKDRDAEPEKKTMLADFRHKVQSKKLCKLWKSVDELEARVATTITAAKDLYKREGFVRASLAVNHKQLSDLLTRNQELERELSSVKTIDEKVLKVLSEKKATLEFVMYSAGNEARTILSTKKIGWRELPASNGRDKICLNLKFSWLHVFKFTGESLLAGCEDEDFARLVADIGQQELIRIGLKVDKYSAFNSNRMVFPTDNARSKAELFFRTLGLMDTREVERTNRDGRSYSVRSYALTKKGVEYLGEIMEVLK